MKPISNLKIFVYGTLKPGEANYSRYCDGHIVSQQQAYIKGTLYNLPFGYPAMTKGDNKAKGILLTFKNPSIIENLDRLEGYQSQRDANLNEYYRSLVSVYSLDDRLLDRAWAYFMTLKQVQKYGGVLVESNWWTGVKERRMKKSS